MSRQYTSSAAKQSREVDLEGAKTPLESQNDGEVINTTQGAQIARECLQYMNPKQIADACGVAVRTVQKWAAGERDIPRDRVSKIIVQAKGYFMDLSRVESAVDRILINIYGNNRGNF